MDEDDECMESDFRTLQKEEYRSTRAGKICLIFIFYLFVFLKVSGVFNIYITLHYDSPR